MDLEILYLLKRLSADLLFFNDVFAVFQVGQVYAIIEFCNNLFIQFLRFELFPIHTIGNLSVPVTYKFTCVFFSNVILFTEVYKSMPQAVKRFFA